MTVTTIGILVFHTKYETIADVFYTCPTCNKDYRTVVDFSVPVIKRSKNKHCVHFIDMKVISGNDPQVNIYWDYPFEDSKVLVK
jgi:hypothetical protein